MASNPSNGTLPREEWTMIEIDYVDRTAKNCYFACDNKPNKCSILRDEYTCMPKTCKWHRTKEEYLESLYKASCTYEKTTGRDDYGVRFVPMSLHKDFADYKAKRKREQYGES